MMKCILLAGAMLLTCATAQATQTTTKHDDQSAGINIIADRLATKSLSDIVTIAMQLQLECQQINSQDVCGGVKSILTVLDGRIASLPKSYDEASLAFLAGLMEGVDNANKETLGRIRLTE